MRSCFLIFLNLQTVFKKSIINNYSFSTYKKIKNKVKNFTLQNYVESRKIYSSIYCCFSLSLINRLIIEYFKKVKTKKLIHGTLRFGFNCINEYPLNSITSIEECGYQSFYFIKIANRFYRRFLNLNSADIFNIVNQEQVFLNIRYLVSLVELTIKSQPKEKFIFYSSSSGNKIVDILFQRYYQKRYCIEVKISYISKIIKPTNLFFYYKRISINKSFLFYPFSSRFKINYKKLSSKGFIHHEDDILNAPYNKLKNDLSKNNEFVSLNFLSIFQIGSKNKIYFLKKIFNYSINLIKKNYFQIIRFNLYKEIIQTISNQIYYLCCINSIKYLKLKSITISSIDINFEKILYKACKDTNTKSIFYDYSMGYPGKLMNKFLGGKKQIDFNREPDYIITNGILRCNQYNLKGSLKSKKNTIVINSICPQIEFAKINIKKKLDNNIKDFHSSDKPKISIFDNNFGYNFYITEKDARSCTESIKIAGFKGIILCHNKRKGTLENCLIKSKLDYITQPKGDFTNVYYSDFIISIGFQGAALKSSFAFKKPLIFFIENNFYFDKADFSLSNNKNIEIRKIIQKLTFNKISLSLALSNKKNYKNFLIQINKNTLIILRELGLKSNLNSAHKIIDKILNTD